MRPVMGYSARHGLLGTQSTHLSGCRSTALWASVVVYYAAAAAQSVGVEGSEVYSAWRPG
jgi:hypothetical protein